MADELLPPAGSPEPESPPQPADVPESPPPVDPVTPDPPPAAQVVATGKRTERELDLEKHLALSEAARKKAETDAAYLRDENRRLKDATREPKRPKKGGSNWTFFED